MAAGGAWPETIMGLQLATSCLMKPNRHIVYISHVYMYFHLIPLTMHDFEKSNQVNRIINGQ